MFLIFFLEISPVLRVLPSSLPYFFSGARFEMRQWPKSYGDEGGRKESELYSSVHSRRVTRFFCKETHAGPPTLTAQANKVAVCVIRLFLFAATIYITE